MAKPRRQKGAAHPVIQAAVSHFRPDEVRVIEVPEWGTDGAPLEVFVKPMTLADRNVIFGRAKADDLATAVDIILRKALNEDGSKMFGPAERVFLMNKVDPAVVTMLSAKICYNAAFEHLAKTAAEEIEEDAEDEDAGDAGA